MSTYPDELCLSDAEANGLDSEALREQVLELLGTGVELDVARLRAGGRVARVDCLPWSRVAKTKTADWLNLVCW